MKRRTLFLSAITLAAFLSIGLIIPGCSFDGTNDPVTNSSMVKTALAGQVVDETGKAIAGATVTAYGKTTTTTAYGTFMLSNVDVPSERCVIKVTKSGYFTAYRAEEPKAGGITQVRMGLMSNAPQGSFASSAGKTVTLSSSASVTLPANGYMTEDGKAYSGQVSYAIRHLDPSVTNFYDFFAGDFQGRSTDGSVTNMLSYGVLRVELTGSSGQKVNIATGSKATLSVPVPAAMASYAPSSLPLWSFDEASGMWKEESVATKQGNKYVGDVTHFSEWNFDAKDEPATLIIHVHCDNDIVPGVVVRVGQRSVVSDESDIRIRRVQGGVPIKIKVHPEDNNGWESEEKEVMLTAGEEKRLDLRLTTCPAFIKGILNNCETQPIDGTIVGEYADGTSFFGFARKGAFKIRVKTGVAMNVKAFADDGRESDFIPVPAVSYDQVYDMGMINACQGNVTVTHDFDLRDGKNQYDESGRGVLTKDGTKYISFINGKVSIWNTADGSLIRDFSVSGGGGGGNRDSIAVSSLPLDISDDASVVLVQTSSSTYATYNVNTGNKITDFNDNIYAAYLSPDGSKVLKVSYVYNNSNQTYDWTIGVYSATDGSQIKAYTTLNGEKINFMSITDFLPNDQFGIILEKNTTTGGNMYIINIADGSEARHFDVKYGRVVGLSPDGSVVAIAGGQTTGLSFYKVADGSKISTITNSNETFYYNLLIAISYDNARVVLQMFNGREFAAPSVYGLNNGMILKLLSTPATNTRFINICYSSDGKKLSGLYKDATTAKYKLRLWEF